MRSGNGRHRRPRQAPALFVTAGVTGAGLALPLLGASGAHAADAGTWDRVAQCESGGLWSANEENGYYGGLQLTTAMWEQYGGTAYAERPDLASRSQQIAVAEKILAAQGESAFPQCAGKAGLASDDERRPGVDPGDGSGDRSPQEYGSGSGGGLDASPRTKPKDGDEGEGKQDPSGSPSQSTPTPSEDSSQPPSDSPSSQDPSQSPSDPPSSHRPSDDPSGDPSDSPSDDPSDSPSGSPSDSGSPSQDPSGSPTAGGPESGSEAGRGDGQGQADGEGTGKHRGRPDERERAADQDGEHPSRGGDRTGSGKHRVRPGDSLSEIAKREDVNGGWNDLYERNRKVVGDDPDLIVPGQKLKY
ncbi:transglycosylase family protein [Streptomyces boncukensis]|uniref:LysM peptidoglycan-binding domain-containing protein n=1 Tax=Streptomyces boncukensis TaxID=2711219 RepID=A0A6G4WVQ8_9ACTN|nr:transglycosylase family protein [Streptomyces boncukensis]NGO68710.1 LysM peptidoglycan-binding domain-containing protein [Streptomyces boncukensis]